MTEQALTGRDASRAGFVLVGGSSSRMGRDKALIEFQGSPLAVRIAECVRGVAGNVTLVGPPDRYLELGYPVIPDRIRGSGPLGGVYTALESTNAEWNLIVACDMPFVTADLFHDLFRDAESSPSSIDCVVPELVGQRPERDSRLDPLCAIYRRRCAVAARRAVDRNLLKMQEFVSTLQLRKHPVASPTPLSNFNTPLEWSAR